MNFKVTETCEPGNSVLPGKRAVSACTAVDLETVIKSERNGAALKASELLELWLPGADEHVKTGELPGRYF